MHCKYLPSIAFFALTTTTALPVWAASAPAGPVVGRMGATEVRADQITDLIAAQTPEVRKTLASQPDTIKDLIRAELLRRTVLGEARQSNLEKRANVAIAMDRAHRADAATHPWAQQQAYRACSTDRIGDASIPTGWSEARRTPVFRLDLRQ